MLPHPEAFSGLTGELLARAVSAWREGHNLVEASDEYYMYSLCIFPDVVVHRGQRWTRPGSRDISVEAALEPRLRTCIDALYHLRINSDSFNRLTLKQLVKRVPCLPCSIMDRIREELDAAQVPPPADPDATQVISHPDAAAYTKRVKALRRLAKEVRGFLSRLALNPYEALDRPGPGTRPYVPKNEERDKFIYDLMCDGVLIKQIMSRVNATQGWAKIATERGITLAGRRYAIRHGLPLPTPRKRGRPKANG
jgi:hypothetical protein